MKLGLRDYQMEAIRNMRNGCILCGGVGSGKSRTALAYYYIKQGGIYNDKKDILIPCPGRPSDLYIITTAKKRDSAEWEGELLIFRMSTNPELNTEHGNKIVVDSWNNIEKYKNVKDSFFIFDEQRVVGYGAWSKAFIKIARDNGNQWILLSATPGDTWSDYMTVFIANGFYKNKTEFINSHIVYSKFCNFPKVDRYISVQRLERLRDRILVTMDFNRTTVCHHEDVYCNYDIFKYKNLIRDRWNYTKDKPIENASEFCYELRKICNSDRSRIIKTLEIMAEKKKAIIFYNFDYELEILKNTFENSEYASAEWNGHKHQPIPRTDKWVYFVQYNAGAEGWNCIRTDTIIFYSQNYSWKMTEQASGRINRMNTPYKDLYFYHLKSRSGIDLAINKALLDKKKFNEVRFLGFKDRP